MAELTKEQLDKAEEAFSRVYKEKGGEDTAALRAAAPFLQLPWDEPTAEEFSEIQKSCRPGMTSLHRICEFVRRRNATFLPKSVDPRKQAVVAVILGAHVGDADKFADRILAAIDKVEDGRG